jgi:hypothetical protein
VIGNHIRRPSPVTTEIRKANWSSWRDYCRIEDVPDSARLMRIIASQLANRVESIILLDGQYIQFVFQGLLEKK